MAKKSANKIKLEELYEGVSEIPKEDIIKWVLHLFDINFEDLSDQELEDLEEACSYYAHGISINKLKTLVPIIKEGFEEFVPKNPAKALKNKKITEGIELLATIAEIRFPIQGGVLALLKVNYSGKVSLERIFMSSMESMFLEDIISSLEVSGLQLFRCKKCQKIYFKVRRQEYCSKSCSNSARQLKYYAKHSETVREKRREVYAENIASKLPGAKVKHRKRLKSD